MFVGPPLCRCRDLFTVKIVNFTSVTFCVCYQVALETFKDFASVEPDLIWLSLNDLYCPREFNPPHQALKPVKLAGVGPQSKEYADNVNLLLSAM